jgi:prevent-host-death family protein
MTSSGVRELRQRASELLRRVEAGETIEITDRGRPVAILAPMPDQGPIERLRATGDLEPAGADLRDLPEPLPLPHGQPSPSEVLERLRSDER